MFRAQLILHDQVREVFESSLRLARESGYLKKRGMRVALDTTYILGRGAVKDTYNLLADGIVKRCLKHRICSRHSSGSRGRNAGSGCCGGTWKRRLYRGRNCSNTLLAAPMVLAPASRSSVISRS